MQQFKRKLNGELLTDKGLSDTHRQYLRQIGLTIQAVRLYELLLEKGSLSAQAVAIYTGDHPSAEYRLFYALEGRRLVRRLSGRPRRFEALPLPTGLKASFQDNEQELRAMIGSLSRHDGQSEILDIIPGRKALYNAYVRYAKTARQEIMLYSIGIAYSETLETSQRQARKRGVRIRHIIQQRKLSNQYIVSKWLKAGVKLRYLKQPRGFHFFVIDDELVCITFSDANDTENRLSIVTNNGPAVKLFMQQFNLLWQQAREIES